MYCCIIARGIDGAMGCLCKWQSRKLIAQEFPIAIDQLLIGPGFSVIFDGHLLGPTSRCNLQLVKIDSNLGFLAFASKAVSTPVSLFVDSGFLTSYDGCK
jgi:hypothetical protein